MGRKRQASTFASELERGVSIRTYATGMQVFQIQFSYRGQTCKEVLPGLDVSQKTNQRYANNLKASIELAKTKGTFKYSDFFPNSPKVAIFEPIELKKQLTIAQCIDIWLETTKRTIQGSSAETYEKQARLIKDEFGKLSMLELAADPSPIREWIKSKNVTVKTMRNYLRPLRQIFDDAMGADLLQYNPIDRINLKKLIAKADQNSDYIADPLSPSEINAFLACAKEARPHWVNYFQFMFYTGLRPSEAYALKWENVDLKAGLINISGAVVQRTEKAENKTAASKRVLFLLPKALEALQSAYALRAISPYVWLRPNYRPITDYEHTDRPWKFIQQEAKIRPRNQYQSRHTFCSCQVMAGNNLFFIAGQLGHTDTEMITKVYGKWIESPTGFNEDYSSFRVELAQNKASSIRAPFTRQSFSNT